MSYPPPANIYPPAGYPQKPNNNLAWSILSTIFCCLPFGIAAIVASAKVDGLWASGQYAEAQKAAADAKKWITWSVGVAVAVLLGYVLLAVVIGVAGGSGY